MAAIGKQKAVPFWVILVELQENAPLRSQMYVKMLLHHLHLHPHHPGIIEKTPVIAGAAVAAVVGIGLLLVMCCCIEVVVVIAAAAMLVLVLVAGFLSSQKNVVLGYKYVLVSFLFS